MTHQVQDESGQMHEFPDEATPEMIAAALGVKYQPNNMPETKSTMFGQMQPPGQFMQEGSFVSPEQTKQVFNAGMGAPGMQLYGEAAPMMSPLAKFAGKALGKVGEKIGEKYPSLKETIEKFNPKNMAYKIQKGADKLRSQSSDIYNFIKDQAKQYGIKMQLPEHLIDEAASHLPKTRASELLIQKAKNGDYEALHQLQSDLGTYARKSSRKGEYASDLKAEEIADTRNKINEFTRDKFKEYGHDYLANYAR
jgi:hypothetical protein